MNRKAIGIKTRNWTDSANLREQIPTWTRIRTRVQAGNFYLKLTTQDLLNCYYENYIFITSHWCFKKQPTYMLTAFVFSKALIYSQYRQGRLKKGN